jgi:hypothetical protein
MFADSVRRAPFSVLAAIGFNLVPIIGVLFWGWSAFALIFLYWLENVVIGVRTLLSMLLNGALTKSLPAVLFFAPFFAVHYGIFCYGHGVFVVLMFGHGEGSSFDLVSTAQALLAEDRGLGAGLASIVLFQIVQLLFFIVRGDVMRTNARELMGAPYPRIIMLHLVIIFGGGLVMMLGEPVAGVVLLALFKTAFDVMAATGWRPKAWRDRD